MTPKEIKQRRLSREHGQRMREFDRLVAKSKENELEFRRKLDEYEERSQNIQLVTQMVCGMPISLFTTKEDTDRWSESVQRLANELGVPLNKGKTKLRAVS